jgi:hypothetical protein
MRITRTRRIVPTRARVPKDSGSSHSNLGTPIGTIRFIRVIRSPLGSRSAMPAL